MYTVLSLDGGGIKGLYSAILLDKIATLLDKNLHDMFDLVIGTSIGGMLAVKIASDMQSTPLANLFTKKNTTTIFDKSLIDSTVGIFQWKPVYNGKGKRTIINKMIPDIKLCECKIPVAVTSFQLGNFRPCVFKSWEDKDISARLAADITSAAPVYFPSVRYNGKWHVDGGVGVNNPSMLGIIYAKQHTDKPIRMLSIGTGSWFPQFDEKKVDKWGLVDWVKNGLLDMLMSGSNFSVDEYSRLILSDNYLRLNNKKLIDIGIDNTSDEAIEQIKQLADETFEKKKDKIIQLFDTSNHK